MNGACGEEKQRFNYEQCVARRKIWCLSCGSLPEWASCIASLMVTCPRFVLCWQYRYSWLGSLQIFLLLPLLLRLLLLFLPLPPGRLFHFVCWWEFRKVLAFLPFGCWTQRVNWVNYLRRADLWLFTSRHGMTLHKTWNLQQRHCENRIFHIVFGIRKTWVRFDMQVRGLEL